MSSEVTAWFLRRRVLDGEDDGDGGGDLRVVLVAATHGDACW